VPTSTRRKPIAAGSILYLPGALKVSLGTPDGRSADATLEDTPENREKATRFFVDRGFEGEREGDFVKYVLYASG